MSEEIISSAYSFFNLPENLEIIEEEKEGKFIKAWRINTNTNEKQFTKEENQEDSQIAIQEEYETYGTEGEKRLIKRTFYKKPHGFPEVAYIEIFSYKEYERIIPPEGQISSIYIPIDPKNPDKGCNEIGFKYYDGEGNDLNDLYSFFLIYNGNINNYEPYISKNVLEQFSDSDPFILKPDVPLIIQNIAQKVIKVRTDELGCSYKEKLAIFIANDINGIKDHCSIRLENNINLIEHVENEANYFNSYPFNELSPEQCYEKFLLDLDLSEEEKSKNFVVIPIALNKHVSTMIIDLRNKKLKLFDSSLYHDKKIFGNFDVEMLNKNNLQMYGTCSYWMIGVCSVLQDYVNVNMIENDCKSGLFQLKVATKICQMFEESQKPTIKYPFNDESRDKDSYFKFEVEIDGNKHNFGINKNYSSCKFINVSDFLKTLVITNCLKYEQLQDSSLRTSKINQETNSDTYFKIEELKKKYNNCLKSFKNKQIEKENNEKKQLLSEWRLLYYKKELLQNEVLLQHPAKLPEINDIDSRISKIRAQIDAINEEIERKNIETEKEFNKTHNINDFINSIYSDGNWNDEIEKKIKELGEETKNNKENISYSDRLKECIKVEPELADKYSYKILDILDDIVFAKNDEITSLYDIDNSEAENIRKIYSEILNSKKEGRLYLEINEDTKKILEDYLKIKIISTNKVSVADVFNNLSDKLSKICDNIEFNLNPDNNISYEEEITSNQKYDYSKKLLKEMFLIKNQLNQEESKPKTEQNQLKIDILNEKLSILDYKVDWLLRIDINTYEDLNKYTLMLNNIKRTGDVKKLEECYFNYHYSGKEDSPVERDPLYYNKTSSNIKECLIKNYQLITNRMFENLFKNENEYVFLKKKLDILEKKQEIETIKIKLAKGDNSVSENLLKNKKEELKNIKISFKNEYNVTNITTAMSQRPKSCYETIYRDLRVNDNKKLKKMDRLSYTKNEKYNIYVDDNSIFIKTKDSSIFRDIQEIKINKIVNKNYMNDIISKIEKSGFGDLLEQNIPIQLKRKGRNIYEEMEKFTAKTIDSKLLQHNEKIIQFGSSIAT